MNDFPGHKRLRGPELLYLDKFRVKTPDDYDLWHRLMVAIGTSTIFESSSKVTAWVNFGRWLATCAYCGKAMLTRPDWGTACCSVCGARYAKGMVTFPSDPAVEKALLARPDPDTQHWDDKQTAVDLEKENREELHLV